MNGDDSYKRQSRLPAVRGVLVAVLLTMLGALAGCDQEPEVRVITPDSASSTCIGDPETPVCAVETMLACLARADESLCEIALRGPEGIVCRSPTPIESVCARFPDGIDHDFLGLFYGDEEARPRTLYRIKRIEAVPSVIIAPNLAYFPDVPNPHILEIDVDRWICSGGSSFPAREPNGSISNQAAGLLRRIETAMWEVGVAGERPSRLVWYEAGSDYCWFPLKYWVWKFRENWIVIRWTREAEPYCEASDGCPEWKWPPYRMILDSPSE